MIEIKNLQFDYPRSSFRLQVDELAIETGACVAIVGPSGSGKTTLLNLIAGIVVPVQGEIRVGERAIHGLSDAARRNFRITNIGMVFQQFELIEYLTVRDNILLPFYVNHSLQLTAQVRDRAIQAAQSMGLGDKLQRTSRKLSQGEQQRVAICRALINQPKLILADEPTGNLDPENKGLILELLFDYSRQNNATLVVVTHDTGILEGFDDTIDFAQFRQVDQVEVVAAVSGGREG